MFSAPIASAIVARLRGSQIVPGPDRPSAARSPITAVPSSPSAIPLPRCPASGPEKMIAA